MNGTNTGTYISYIQQTWSGPKSIDLSIEPELDPEHHLLEPNALTPLPTQKNLRTIKCKWDSRNGFRAFQKCFKTALMIGYYWPQPEHFSMQQHAWWLEKICEILKEQLCFCSVVVGQVLGAKLRSHICKAMCSATEPHPWTQASSFKIEFDGIKDNAQILMYCLLRLMSGGLWPHPPGLTKTEQSHYPESSFRPFPHPYKEQLYFISHLGDMGGWGRRQIHPNSA